ncbi:MAG: hypothetical protein V5789_04235 [Colwellia sp.]
MTNIIFSGLDKTFFTTLTFNKKVKVSWLPIDELVNADTSEHADNTKFILFYNTPEKFLMSLNSNTLEGSDKAETQWLPKIELLTQFYLINQHRAVLLDHEQCAPNIEVFLTLINEKLAIEKQSIAITKASNDNALGEQLFSQSLQLSLTQALSDNYVVQEAYENLMSAADLIVDNDDFSIEQRKTIYLKSCQRLVEKTRELSECFDQLKAESDLSLLHIQQLQEELAQTQESHHQLVQEKSTLNSNVADLTAKNDLSLLQIQQLQEELEAMFLERSRFEQELLKQSEVEKSELEQSNEAAEKVAAELAQTQERNNQLVQEKSTLNSNVADLTAENDLSLLQIQQLQEELEAMFLERSRFEQELLKKSEVENSELEQSNEAAEKVAAELAQTQESHHQLVQEKSTLDSNVADLTAEKDLSLLHIQQLQEELVVISKQHVCSEKQCKYDLTQSEELANQIADELAQIKESHHQLAQEKSALGSNFSELSAENELFLLQIQQLQEELEFYFIKYQSLSTNNFISNKTPIKISDKRFEKSLGLARLLNA